jgi:hypothetical protein
MIKFITTLFLLIPALSHSQNFSDLLERVETLNQQQHHIGHNKIFVVDYSKKITEKRFFLLDLKDKKIIYSTYVGHAWRSGRGKPKKFSNKPNTNKSSLGIYRVGKKYKSNYFENAFRLHGLSKTNSNALRRSIVIHDVPVDYIENPSGLIVSNLVEQDQLYSDGCFTFFPWDFKDVMKFFEDVKLLYAIK